MLVVVFGPLIIMLLVGFAFNNNTTSKLNIGYYANQKTDLTKSFIDALVANPSFLVIPYASDTQCIDMIHQGKVHLCIIFPDDFRVENNKSNELQFYVDQSRANFVYAVIDTVSSKISVTSTQLSYQMTTDLINVIDSTKKSNTEQLAKITKIKNSLNDVSTKLGTVQSKLGELDFSGTNIDMDPVDKASAELEISITKLKDVTDELVSTSETAGSALTGHVDSNWTTTLTQFKKDIAGLKSDANTSINSTGDDLAAVLNALEIVSTDVDLVSQKLSDVKETTGDSVGDIENNIKALSQLKTSIDELKSLIETNNAQINALKVTNAQSIVNPIKTTIKPVSGKSGNLSFIFPYFIILIIVFIGIMLSSSIIIMEKTSKAYFRNFTTPTKDLTFVMSVFLTSFIVVLLQLVFILGLAYFFLNASMFSNLLLTVILILGAISLFTLVGMVIGYAFNNQEAVTMASISVGSIFLFLSNLILPLETMSPVVQQIARYNPYVVCSELLKKLTLFESTFKEVYMDYVIIAIYVVLLFVLTMLIEKASKIQFISKKPITKQLARQKDQPIERYFKLKNGVLLMSEKDLLEELATMSDKEFEGYVNKKRNDFEAWLVMNNKQALADKVSACETRKEMMAALGASIDKIDPIAAAGIDKVEKSGKDSKDKEPKEEKDEPKKKE
jgi:ABC-type multidrug transport system permease subunit